MKPLQQRRFDMLQKQMVRLRAQREQAIHQLVTAHTKISALHVQIARYEKINNKVDPVEEGIPDFLRRKHESARKDAELAAKIQAERAACDKAKSRARIDKLKAKQRGDLARMPLQGKAALAAIRED